MSRFGVFPLILWFALGFSGMGPEAMGAEPSPPDKKAREANPAAAQAPAKQGPAAKQSDPAGVLRHDQVIYVPFKNLRDVFERDDSSVVLPYGQFLQMRDQLPKPGSKPVEPPVKGVVARAEYRGAVKGELLSLDATLDLEVLSDGWAQLPVQFGDAAIGSATSDDASVLLRGVGEGRYEFLVRGQGKHQVKLTLVTGVKSGPEGRSVTVQCPAVGVSNLELLIPETDLAIHVTPQRTLEVQPEANRATRLRAVLGSTNQFTVAWQPKSGGSETVAGLANVTDTIAVDVGDGVVHTQAVFDYQILRGSLGELLVDVPSDQRLLDVQAPGLRDWQTETVAGRQRVKVRLHAPATQSVRLELHTEAPIAQQAFEVGGVRAVGAARESGILAVRAAEEVGLEFVARESITRVDAADVPESLRKPGSTFYKFFTPNHKLSVTAAQLKPRILVESRLSVLAGKARLTTRGEFTYRISRSGIFSLSLGLPPGFQLDEVRTESMERFEVSPASAPASPATLTVFFAKKVLGDVAVSVSASQARDKPAGEIALPLLEPLGATREEGLVAVLAPESLELKTDAAQLRAARAATPAELSAKGFQPQVPAGSTLAAAFSFTSRPVGIVQTIAQRPRRTLASVVTVANVKEDVVQVATTLRYQVQFAGTDTFRIAVPAAASDRLQIDGEGIRERRKSAKPSADGSVEWTIVLHSEALGPRTFTAAYDRRISAGDKAAPLEIQPIQVLDADRESGEIAVQKDRALSVDAKPSGLEEIDPRELSQPVGTAPPYLAYRYYQHPVRLTLSVTRHEIEDVVKTVVRRAYIEAVLTADGPMTVRARYDVKSSERQRLAVTLPNPRILGITVAGQTVAPEKAPAAEGAEPDDKTYFINVARPADSDESFPIAAVFETPLPDATLGVHGLLRLALPRFDAGVKFQKVYVRVWTPKEYRLVGDPGGFTSHVGVGLWDSRAITEAPDDPDAWFSKDSSPFDFRVGGTNYLFSSLAGPAELAIGYWHIPTMTVIASLAVLAVGVVLLWFPLEIKVLSVLAAAFAILFAGLFVPSLVYSWLLAGRIGIACVVALWTVVWLLHVRRTGLSTRSLAGDKTGRPPEPNAAIAALAAVAPVSATPAADGPTAAEQPQATEGPEAKAAEPGGEQP